MTFKFFRKRQKMIFAFMALLMVFFLIGSMGLSIIFEPSAGERRVIAAGDGFEIDTGAVGRAELDLRILRLLAAYMAPDEAAVKRLEEENIPAFLRARYVSRIRQMLLAETLGGAELAGVLTALPRCGSSQDEAAVNFAVLLAEARGAGVGVTADEVENLVAVMNTAEHFDFERAALELRQRGDTMTRSNVLTALSHVLAVYKRYRSAAILPPPGEQQLLEIFRDIREKISVAVLRIDAGRFADRVEKPTPADREKTFATYREYEAGVCRDAREFTFGYRVPAKEKTAYLHVDREALARAGGETDAGQDYRAFVGDVRSALNRETAGAGVTAENAAAAYEAVENYFTKPDAAAALLSRRIGVVAIPKTPLKEAVRTLALLAGSAVDRICFPWGAHGKINISPDVKVTLALTDATLEDALVAIRKQIPDLPAITWSVCRGYEKTLFPVSGSRLFPVTAGVTEMLTEEERGTHPRLSAVWKAEFKTVVASVNSAVPETMTGELADIVTADCLTRKAFALAVEKAGTLTAPAAMTAFAEKNGIALITTGLFSRDDRYGGALSELAFEYPDTSEYFIKRVFALQSPADLEADYPPASAQASVIPAAAEETVYVVRRVDFRPALQSDFTGGKDLNRGSLSASISRRGRFAAMSTWFNPEHIRKRTGFRLVTPGDE